MNTVYFIRKLVTKEQIHKKSMYTLVLEWKYIIWFLVVCAHHLRGF